jgi:asparagine synthase (glutamine-hydrolysing)
MRVAVLYSSGKDSTVTLWCCKREGYDVACLLSLLPENPDSYMFQKPKEELLKKQAESLGIPILFQHTQGEKEIELDDLKAFLERAKQEYGVECIASGALASDYQYDRINKLCADLSLKTYAPLWHKDQEEHMRETIDLGFDVRLTRIAADGLDKSWLGRKLTQEDVDKLVMINKGLGINIAGEGGEFESIVLDGPLFTRPIRIEYAIVEEGEHRAELRITSVE